MVMSRLNIGVCCSSKEKCLRPGRRKALALFPSPFPRRRAGGEAGPPTNRCRLGGAQDNRFRRDVPRPRASAPPMLYSEPFRQAPRPRISMTRFAGTDSYIATEDLKLAVNAAITLERPLLVKGE